MDHAPSPAVDTSRPRSARVWNYWLGGTENFAVDRDFADRVAEVYPEIVTIARECRAFLARVVGFLVGEAGVRQFLDVGTGMPTADYTHELAQRAAPACRVVYVDNDPLVLARARARAGLTGTPEGTIAYVEADVRDPDKILTAAAETLDFTRPIALILTGVMGNIADADEACASTSASGGAYAIVSRLRDAVPSGSYLVVSDGTHVFRGDRRRAALRGLGENGGFTYHLRSPEEIAGFLDGLGILEPGVVPVSRWRPTGDIPAAVDQFGGVGRKP